MLIGREFEKNQMLLEIKNLDISYNSSTIAVDRVSLNLAAGESLGLVGESGCGKSTLGRSLIQLLPPLAEVAGEIKVQGASLLDLSIAQLQHWRGEKVALIFQDPMTRLDPLMTIERHGIEVLRSHYPQMPMAQVKQNLNAALQAVQINPNYARQYPHEFSGGMRQRVMIALSLLLEPTLLIADEPTTSLDVTVAAGILEELTALRHSRHMGLLLITHDLGLVGKYCDRIAVMYEGQIVETGTTAEIFQNPQHPYTKSLWRSVIHFQGSCDQASSPQNSQPTLLKVENLTKQYFSGGWAALFNGNKGEARGINGINLEIRTGDILGMIGESGSGKSTTGRAILQLIKPDRGSVQFNGVELTNLPPAQLRKLRSQIQMIFQDPRACLNPRMTVFQSMADPLLIHKIEPNLAACKVKVLDILDKVGLPKNFSDRLPQQLSGGQLQRVAIGRALITRPRFLICDEPVSMLDATIQSQILALMLDLKREFGLTYLFITHNLAVAQFLCTHIAVMYRGTIVEQGTTSQVLGHPQHNYTKTLIESVPRYALS